MIQAAIAWFIARQGKVTYSMVDRNGPSSYDCSSAIYHALIEAGIFPSNILIGNTDSEFGDLERHGFVQLPEDASGHIDSQYGDIFIWGVRGQSGGGFGHTGMFVDADNIIHCSYGYNGIHTDNHDWLWSINGEPPVTIYRYEGVNDPHDQDVQAGSWIRFDKTYTADEVRQVGKTWQVRTNELCKAGFTWDDNGIPAGLLVEVDGEGFATGDQELDNGSRYKIPGKFLVLDVGQSGDNWLAQIGFGGLSFWVDLASATEVADNDAGTPVPAKRQTNITPAPEPTPQPEPEPVPVPQPSHDDDQDKQIASLQALVQKIVDFLSSIFKGFNK